MKKTANSIYLWSLYGFALLMPIAPRKVPVCLILMLLSWLFSGMPSQISSRWKALTRGGKWLMLVWPLYYVLHILGLIHSEDMAFAGLDLGIKVWLFILPPLLILKGLSDTVRQNVFKLFIVSTVASFFFNLALSSMAYVESADSAHFLGQEFSHTMHIAYYGVCLLISLMILVHYTLQRKAVFTRKQMIVVMVMMLICITGIFLTGSKMTFIMLVIFMLLALIQFMRINQNKRVAWVSIGLVMTLFSGLYFGTERLKERMDTMIERTFYRELDPQSMESTMCRRMTWDASIDLIQAAPLIGTGTGDIKNELVRIYHQKGYVGPEEARLNSHSQFLQSFAALGIAGVLIMLLAHGLLTYQAVKEKDFLAFSFAICLAMALMTESMLERQTGVLLMGFFFPLLASRFKT